MRTNTLGVAGPDVSAIGLGTMTFGQETDAAEAELRDGDRHGLTFTLIQAWRTF